MALSNEAIKLQFPGWMDFAEMSPSQKEATCAIASELVSSGIYSQMKQSGAFNPEETELVQSKLKAMNLSDKDIVMVSEHFKAAMDLLFARPDDYAETHQRLQAEAVRWEQNNEPR